MIKSLIFDFGGTIDTNGIHWIEKFWSAYEQHSIHISKDEFINAYIFSERRMNEKIKNTDTFKTTIKEQLSMQFEYLLKNSLCEIKKAEITEIAEECYLDAEKNISQFRNFINKLEDEFSFAMVSNFYGNLNTVLEEFDIKKFFKVITDSTIVKIRKPDPEIFSITIRELSVKPENTFVIGDSFENDIKPAKKLGCSTIWLINKNYKRKNDNHYSDYEISSIQELQSILDLTLQKNNF